MLNKHECLTTEESNRLLLPSGRITVNRDNWNLRIHDGEVMGGYEVSTVRAFTPPDMGPGSQELLVGNMDHGFFGEVTGEELFTYEDLASLIGLSAGTSIYNDESLWLKFTLDGQILYVAKKPARHTVSWDQLNARSAVYEGGTQVTVGLHTFDVTLLRGAASDPTVAGPVGSWTGYDIDLSNGSEWNRLMYPIHSGTHSNADNPEVHSDPLAEPFGSWASYADSDLVLASGNGRLSWTQEVSGDSSDWRVCRGHNGVTLLGRSPSSGSDSNSGWRPCLRLIT